MGKSSGKSKINVRFEVDVLAIEGLPDSYKSDGVVLHWKRSGSSKAKGSSHPVLVQTPTTSFDPDKEHTRFIFNCRFFREALSGSFSPTKAFTIAVQLEKVSKSKKIALGKLSFGLNAFAEDGTDKTLTQPLTKSPCFPPPTMRLTIRTFWETIDGYVLKDSIKPPTEEVVKLRQTKSRQLRQMVRRTSVSLFPTGKVNINGKSYELYENPEEDEVDASMSLRSEQNKAETEIEFTCDDFDSDDEEEEEDVFAKKKLTKVESAKQLIKTLKPSANQATVPVAHFEITILGATGLSGADGKNVYVSWRRGSKKKNSGRTKKTECKDGVAEWTDLSEDPIRITSTMNKDPKTHKYEEKILGLSVKKLLHSSESNKTQSSSVAHLMLDLAEYAENDLDITKTFELQGKSRSRNSLARSSKIMKLDPIALEKASSKSTIELNICCTLEHTPVEESTSTATPSTPVAGKKSETVSAGSNVPSKGDAPKPKEDKTAFGKPLLDQLVARGSRKHTIPPVLSILINGVKQEGLSRQGIFRLSGRSAEVSEIIKILNEDAEKLDVSMYGPHELADCLKKYLRALPNSLLPDSHYESCLELGNEFQKVYESNKPNPEKLNELNGKLAAFIATFPPANGAALRELCSLLFLVQQNSEENKMHTDNLATVFAPTVIQKEFDDPTRFLIDNAKKVAIMTAMILHSPLWVANEDFSAFDEKLRNEEQSLPPEIRVARLLDRLAESEVEKETLRATIKERDHQLKCSQLQEFIFSTSTKWNAVRNMWQGALDIFEQLKIQEAFVPLKSSFLFTTLRALKILHRRSIGEMRSNCFVLGLCLHLLELWQGEEELLFCGDVLKYGVIYGEFLDTLAYDRSVLEIWEPNEAMIQSPSHFERQFQEFTMLVFYSICRSFPQQYQQAIINFARIEASWSGKDRPQAVLQEKSLVESLVELLTIAQSKHLPQVVVNQIAQGVLREIVLFLILQVSGTPELCTTDAGLKIKMNVTTFLHSLSQHRFLSKYNEFAQEEFEGVKELANLLVSFNNFSRSLFPDAGSLLKLFPTLEKRTVYNILLNYKGDSDEFEKHKLLLLEQIKESAD